MNSAKIIRHAGGNRPGAHGRRASPSCPAVHQIPVQSNPNLMAPVLPRRLAGLTLAAACLPALLISQRTEATAATPPTPAEVIELNPFIVDASRDTGYVVSETLSGTRLKTEVRHIASPVTILTEEFLQDIGATSFADIVKFMPGTETYRFDDSDLRGEQAHNGRTFSARGFRADNQSRDFGLRFTLFDRKIFGSFTYYDTKQLNQVRNSLSEIINDFDDVWDTIENAYATLSPATLAAARLPATPPTRPTDDATAVYSRNTSENNGNPGAIFADTLDSKSKASSLS